MEKPRYKRTPKGYDGAKNTFHHMQELVPLVFEKIHQIYESRGDLILQAWPQIIGNVYASMTQALSFNEGILTVKVSNSTLYSLLNQYEKPKILKILKEKFPSTQFKNINFRLG